MTQCEDFDVIPDEPLAVSEILERIAFLLRQPRCLAHPGYIGNMESMPTTMSIVGALIMAATKINMLAEEMSPFLSAIEPRVIRWFARQFGLGENAGGGLLAGGTLANLQALTVARNAKVGARVTGISNRSRAPVLFASEAAHSSLLKGAMIMGLGTSSVIAVRADANSRMDVGDLRNKIRASRNSGTQEPFCIVATAGTTITGNIDPLSEIAAVAKEFDLWLHTDAIYGGALALSTRNAFRIRGIGHSDSITLNLHKWLYSGLTSSLVIFADFTRLEEHFRIAAPYMTGDSGSRNLGEYSLQGSRQADIIGLLFSLQHLGRLGFSALIDGRMELAETLRSLLNATGAARFTGEMDTNIQCFRPRAESTSSGVAELQRALARDAGVCVTTPRYRGEAWLKTVILNPYTQASHLAELVNTFTAHCQE